MNTAFPKVRHTLDTHLLAATLLLSLVALAACQLPMPLPPSVIAPAAEGAALAGALPEPQAPFDTTPITPVESAGAAAE